MRRRLPLGTCGGFQYALIEFARNVAGISNAAHAETAPDAADRVMERLSCSLIGQERLVRVIPGTRLSQLTGPKPFTGFHWCSYGLAASYVDRLAGHGLVIAAVADDAGIEAVELQGHPFFLATLFQPQIGSSAGRPLSPVIEGFIQALTDSDDRVTR